MSLPTQKSKTVCILGLLLCCLANRIADGAELVGKVVDSRTGEGIAGAIVRAIPQQGKNREVRGHTNDEGRYHLELLRGNYKLHINLPDSNYWPRYYSVTRNEKGDVLSVPAFDSFLELDIPLEAGGTISGTVRRLKDGKLLPDIHVYAETAETRVSGITRSDGTYFLRPLAAGDYRIHVDTLDENYIPLYFDNHADSRKADPVVIHDRDEVSGIDFSLELGGMIRGRVFSHSNHVALARAKIVAEKLKSQEPPRYTLSDSQGNYELRGLTSGMYLLECSLREDPETETNPGKTYLFQYYPERMDRSEAKPLEVQSESLTSEINFDLVEESRISGRIWSAYQKTYIRNVDIRPYWDQNKNANLSDGQSDANGRYLIDHLPPGKYRLQTILTKANQRFVPVYYHNRLNSDLADILEVNEGSWLRSIDFDLTLGASIKGLIRVDDSAYRLETEAVAIHLKPEGLDLFLYGEREIKMRADGTFFLSGIPAGRYQFFPVLKDPNLLPESDQTLRILSMAEGDNLEGLDFTLRVGGSISGLVSSQDPRYPPENLAIILISIKEETQKIFPLKSEQYLIGGLNPGKYLMILTTTPKEISPDRPIPAAKAFDSRYVDVTRGKMSRGIDFLIKANSDSVLNPIP